MSLISKTILFHQELHGYVSIGSTGMEAAATGAKAKRGGGQRETRAGGRREAGQHAGLEARDHPEKEGEAG